MTFIIFIYQKLVLYSLRMKHTFYLIAERERERERERETERDREDKRHREVLEDFETKRNC